MNKIENDPQEGLEGLSIMLRKEELIYTTRRGLVVDVKEDFDDTEPVDSLQKNQKNHIIIQHDDCSYARYESLKEYNVIPNVGDKVDAGQLIANLGDVEYDKGYSLNFFLYFIDYDKAGYHYLRPDFLIEGQRQHAESGGLYKSDHSIELILREMSKREKKKFRNLQDF